MSALAAQRLISDESQEVLRDERALLGRLRELLVSHEAAEADIQLLRQAEADLDEIFLLVVVGEFNAGKSAFINALVGERVMREGVTPTTAAITRLRYGPTAYERRDGALVEIGYPLELLRDVAIVDTPGTNAILREHEEITSHFVPRADLVLFVTSADRPFTETERQFMERIRSWGKKVVVILNKADLLSTQQELDQQVAFVRESVERLLGFSPEVFPISGRQALQSREEADPARAADLLASSRFEPLQRYILTALDPAHRLPLKLATPLGVAERVVGAYVMAAEEKRALLAEDIALADAVEQQLVDYREQMRKDFTFRLETIDNILHEMSARGIQYLDDTIRLGRVMDLVRQTKLKEEFERIVVADTPERIDRAAADLVEWLVDQDLKIWRNITEQVDRRRRAGTADSPAARLSGSFEYDRKAILGTLGQTARDVVQRHDHRREADQLAQSVREAVTQATLIEAGALGLGTVTAIIMGSLAADVTGILVASVIAGLGFLVLPRKRSQAKEQFRTRTEELRTRLTTALKDEFTREIERSIQRIKDALSPYDRFVRAEHTRTTTFLTRLQDARSEARTLRSRVEGFAPPVTR